MMRPPAADPAETARRQAESANFKAKCDERKVMLEQKYGSFGWTLENESFEARIDRENRARLAGDPTSHFALRSSASPISSEKGVYTHASSIDTLPYRMDWNPEDGSVKPLITNEEIYKQIKGYDKSPSKEASDSFRNDFCSALLGIEMGGLLTAAEVERRDAILNNHYVESVKFLHQQGRDEVKITLDGKVPGDDAKLQGIAAKRDATTLLALCSKAHELGMKVKLPDSNSEQMRNLARYDHAAYEKVMQLAAAANFKHESNKQLGDPMLSGNRTDTIAKASEEAAKHRAEMDKREMEHIKQEVDGHQINQSVEDRFSGLDHTKPEAEIETVANAEVKAIDDRLAVLEKQLEALDKVEGEMALVAANPQRATYKDGNGNVVRDEAAVLELLKLREEAGRAMRNATREHIKNQANLLLDRRGLCVSRLEGMKMTAALAAGPIDAAAQARNDKIDSMVSKVGERQASIAEFQRKVSESATRASELRNKIDNGITNYTQQRNRPR